ncbi:MAG: hypothetical protein OER80_07220 [Gammaproteobacteria bacterium]|nr:hypothetical protein [Gammaproteobacteria bacterium]MDH3767685.1 hypothetical protein [Gammaproteobacteria bacterium]
MIGRFLELGLQTEHILDSIGFYEDLGFKQLTVGDIWQHPYAVLSDGTVHVGLHEAPLHAPMITFVLPDLAGEIGELRSRGIEFEKAKTGDDEFNELIFSDPDDNFIRIVEARTFSPPPFDHAESACGRFREITLPVRDLETSAAFWQRLEFEELGQSKDPHPHIWLRATGVVLGLHQTAEIKGLSLSFQSQNISTQLAKLRQAGIETVSDKAPPGVAVLKSPGGLPIFLHGI